jgi:lipoprotein-anchoring transpeptidase ErfK/SrfK
MNIKIIEAHELIAKAREALRRGDKASAQQLGERAARLAPLMEDAWLILAASHANPQAALAYARKALQINPQSERARRAVEWASGRLKQAQALPVRPSDSPAQSAPAVTAPQKRHAYQTAVAMPVLRPQGRNWLLPALLAGTGILILGFLLLFAVMVKPSALASLVNRVSAPAIPQEQLWAQVEIAKPEVTPIDVSAFAVQSEKTPAPTSAPKLRATPTGSPDSEPAQAPTKIPNESAPVIPAATETPGVVAMEILEDTPTSEYNPPKPQEVVGNGERWIDVDLTNQMVSAYEGDVMVNSFLVSTGTWLTPTVTGEYKVYVKYRSAPMTGPGYYLPNVPYIMYFYKSYGLHGTYWHNNFGTPMSHGCVNLRTDDAAWLFDWASVGTVVNVHY